MSDNGGDSADDHNASDEERDYFGNLQIDHTRPHLDADQAGPTTMELLNSS